MYSPKKPSYGTIDILPANFSNFGGYAHGGKIGSPTRSGDYARVSGAPGASGVTENLQTGCSNTAVEDCQGPFMLFGTGKAAGIENVFPTHGFKTSLKVYLDNSWAKANPGQGFGWDVSMNESAATNIVAPGTYYFEDFEFILSATSGGWSITSNASGGSPAVAPASGWYTFTHDFTVGPSGLNVRYTAYGPGTRSSEGPSVYSANQTVATVPSHCTKSGSCSGTKPASATSLGGPDYGWLYTEDVLGLPIADETLTLNR